MIEITSENFESIDFRKGIIAFKRRKYHIPCGNCFGGVGLLVIDRDAYCGVPRQCYSIFLPDQNIHDGVYANTISKINLTKEELCVEHSRYAFYQFDTTEEFAQWVLGCDNMKATANDKAWWLS